MVTRTTCVSNEVQNVLSGNSRVVITLMGSCTRAYLCKLGSADFRLKMGPDRPKTRQVHKSVIPSISIKEGYNVKRYD
jgi:hypothetical protein